MGGQEGLGLSLTRPVRCGTLEALDSSTKASVGVAVSCVSAVGCQFSDGWPHLSLMLVTGRVLLELGRGTPTRAVLLRGNYCQCHVATQLCLPHWHGTSPSSRGSQYGDGATIADIRPKSLEEWIGLVIVSIPTGRKIRKVNPVWRQR